MMERYVSKSVELTKNEIEFIIGRLGAFVAYASDEGFDTGVRLISYLGDIRDTFPDSQEAADEG